MKWRTAALWTTAAVTLFLVGCAIALHVLVDPERLIRLAHDKARAAWQRELHIGNVSVRLWPVPSLHATKVEFANPPWARHKHLLRVDHARADFELLPLLTGKVRIKNLTLEDVIAGLEEGEDGAVSWELQSGEKGRSEKQGLEEAELLQISEVRIRNVRVHHRAKNEDAEPLHIEEARIDAGPGLRDVRVEARLARFQQPLRLQARFADLSRLGEEGAVSEGKLELEWRRTRGSVAGTFPLHKHLRGHALQAELRSDSVQDLLAFLGFKRGDTAPLHVRLRAREVDGAMHVEPLAVTLGSLEVTGDATFTTKDGKPRIHARLQAERLDWLRTLVDAGGTVKPPRQNEEIFHPDPVAWRAVGVAGAIRGTAQLKVRSLRLGNGLELRNVRAKAALGEGRLGLDPFAADALGGSATGSLKLDANRKTVRVELAGTNLLLEQWFRQRGRKVPFSGGPMRIKASLSLSGDTFRELAASVTGPVSLRMGRGLLASKRAGEAEELMVRALAPRDTGEIRFECVSAALDFRNGRATGRRLLGARSDASQLLTSGTIDLREETLDLRGALKARSGPSLGLSAFAGDVQITGKLAKPRIQLDPDQKPAIVARAGAAIASAGVTLLGGALVDAAEKNDPCEAVFR